MSGPKISETLKEAFNYMNFETDKTPSMKDLISRYRKLSLQTHPDKNGGTEASTEEYQKLQMYYKLIGDYIIENEVTSNVNEEEMDHINTFKQFNFDKKNKN